MRDEPGLNEVKAELAGFALADTDPMPRANAVARPATMNVSFMSYSFGA
jgi:hypothetical protein